MPKDKENLILRAKKLFGVDKTFEVQSKNEGTFIYCKLCQSKYKIDEIHLKSTFQQHLQSNKHKNRREKSILQPSISTAILNVIQRTTKDDSYSMKLATTFIEAGIPIWKLRHPTLKRFFQQEHNETLPSIQTFYNKIPLIYRNTLEKIKNYIGDNPIYFIADETTDVQKRFVLNILVGKLDGSVSKPLLLSTSFLDKTNNATIQQGIHNVGCYMVLKLHTKKFGF